MNQNNFQQYGYDHYDQPPSAGSPQKKGLVEKIFGQKIATRVKNPLFATAALLLTGAAFAAIIVVTYPNAQQEDVPVIKAEEMAYKEAPATQGGMDIPYRDSTVFTTMRSGQLNESAPVENLLEQQDPAERFAVLEEEAEDALDFDITEEVGATEPAAGDAEETSTTLNEAVEQDETTAAADVKAVEIKKIEQKVEKISGAEIAGIETDDAQTQRPQKLHAPASSPETLAFVRSVLDKKDTKNVLGQPATNVASATTQPAVPPAAAPVEDVSAAALSSIEPSAGAATGIQIHPGHFYVQLASVTSPDGAEKEWGKLLKTYGLYLQGVSHRVQEANLGPRGTFYRVQAGPMNKDSATEICNAIKAQKPGACLVVK